MARAKSPGEAAGQSRLGDSVRPQDFALDGTPLISYLWMLSDLPDGDAVGFAICRGLFGPYVADLVLVGDCVAGALRDAGEGLPHHELEGVLGLIAEKVANRRHLVVTVHDADLLLLVLHCDHAGEYHHFLSLKLII